MSGTVATQSGAQCFCAADAQFVTPAASNARNNLELSSIVKTRPSLTTGVEPLPVNAAHSGVHIFGVPAQFV